jgi:Tol biopolymer transport system component
MKPIRGGLLSAVGVCFLLALAPATSWAAFPGANGLIAYSETRGFVPGGGEYNWEIFTIPPAGGDPTRLTDNAISDTQPSWSANGRRLAFIRGSAYIGQNQNVWTMRADGTHQRQVTHWPASESSPSFSPGGGRIVMARGWDIWGNIVIARTDGTDPVRLTSGRDARDPVFSPNGRRIVFAGRPREERPLGIWVMRRDGTHKRLLANPKRDPNGGVEYTEPDFDPDGSHIVFERCIDDVHECLTDDILIRSNGRHKRVIEGAEGNEPVFSPDGTRIAVVRRFDCVDLYSLCGSRVFTVARGGGDARVVTQPDAPLDGFTQFPRDSSPSWQPIPQP